MLRFLSLGSGSSGNATLVEASEGTSTTRLLVDCGLPLRELDLRLARAGLSAEQIDAVFVTHEHGDHFGHAGRLAARQNIPLWASRGTLEAAPRAWADVEPSRVRVARDGQAFSVGALQVHPFTVPHDAREPLQLHCTDGDERLGILTDLGHWTQHVVTELRGCHSMLLECNHDPELLERGRYPWPLKRRIAGPQGHLSNAEAASLARTLADAHPLQLVAAHLSEENNTPALAREALAATQGCAAADIAVASPGGGVHWWRVRPLA